MSRSHCENPTNRIGHQRLDKMRSHCLLYAYFFFSSITLKAETPSGYARVSFQYEFIRSTVCELSSDPPATFRCPPRISPTMSPPPTTTLAPTKTQPNVLLLIDLDIFPDETWWEIIDSAGDVVASVPVGTYDERQAVTEEISLDAGGMYNLTVHDAGGDGLCCGGAVYLYLGTESDSATTLAYNDGNFDFTSSHPFTVSIDAVLPLQGIGVYTFPPSRSPSQSPSDVPSFVPTGSQQPTRTMVPTAELTTVLLLIDLDIYPLETSWQLTDTNGIVVASAPPGSYSGQESAKVLFDLDNDSTYTLTIFDSFGDEILLGGGAYLFLGTEPDLTMLLVAIDGDFSSSSSKEFTVSADMFLDPGDLGDTVFAPSSTPSIAPTGSQQPSILPTGSQQPSLSPSTSMQPSLSAVPTRTMESVLLLIDFDDFPGDISWEIADSNDQVVASGPAVEYDFLLDFVTETIELIPGATYTLTVFDLFGDGLCCFAGMGNFYLFLGTVPDLTMTLVYDDGRFDDVTTHQFTVSDASLIPTGEVPESPRFTPRPTVMQTALPTPAPTLPSIQCSTSVFDPTANDYCPTTCRPFRYVDFCEAEESFLDLIKARRDTYTTDPQGVFQDGHWYHIIEDKLAAKIFAEEDGIPTPKLLFCSEDVNDILSWPNQATDPTAGIVIKGIGLHSGKGVFVLPNGIGGVELLSGNIPTAAQIVEELSSIGASRFIIEEYVSGPDGAGIPDEYKIHMFSGKVGSIIYTTNRGTTCACFAEFDEDWNRLDTNGCFRSAGQSEKDPSDQCTRIDFSSGHLQTMKGMDFCTTTPARPDNLDEIIVTAKTVSERIGAYIRVDLLAMADGTVLVNEFTPGHTNGRVHCSSRIDENGCVDSCFLGRMWSDNSPGSTDLLHGGPATGVPTGLLSWSDDTWKDSCDDLFSSTA